MIKHTVEELQKMIKASALLEAPADSIVADLAQQLIDVHERLRQPIHITGDNLTDQLSKYVNGFYEESLLIEMKGPSIQYLADLAKDRWFGNENKPTE